MSVSGSDELSEIKTLLKSLSSQAKANSLAIQELAKKRNLEARDSDEEQPVLKLKCKRVRTDHEPPVDVSDTDDAGSCPENDCAFASNFLLPDEELSIASSSDSSPELPIMGSENVGSWMPSARTMDWFYKVADHELDDGQIDSLFDKFLPSPEIAPHFEPPKLPKPIWDRLAKRNKEEVIKQRSIFKSQKLLCGALMPLLSVLDSLDSKDPNQKLLASAIQVLCSANLKLSKTRRGAVRPLVKPELRSILCDQKVSHLHIFGSDFDKCTETASKAHSSITKVLIPPKRKFNNYGKSFSSKNDQASTSDKKVEASQSDQPFHATSSGTTHRSRGYSRRGRNYRNSSSYGGKYKQVPFQLDKNMS